MMNWRRLTFISFVALGTLAVIAVLVFKLGSGPKDRSRPDLARHFQDADACFVMLDTATGQTVRVYSGNDPGRCPRRLSPCSTFKVPHALIALEMGVIPDADTLIPWDGVPRDRAEVNRDHTLRTAIRYSVVWYFQELARRLGEQNEALWLKQLDYGNQDLSAGLTQFWLGTSLAISAEEQVRFLDRLRTGHLPCSQRNMEFVRSCIEQPSRGGMSYRGKTGSSRGPSGFPGCDLGWWVGWVERPDHGAVVFACNVLGQGTFGPQARAMAEAIMDDLGVFSKPASTR